MPRKSNRTCSNLTQATQEAANDMAGICHVTMYTTQSFDKLTHFYTISMFYTTAD